MIFNSTKENNNILKYLTSNKPSMIYLAINFLAFWIWCIQYFNKWNTGHEVVFMYNWRSCCFGLIKEACKKNNTVRIDDPWTNEDLNPVCFPANKASDKDYIQRDWILYACPILIVYISSLGQTWILESLTSCQHQLRSYLPLFFAANDFAPYQPGYHPFT